MTPRENDFLRLAALTSGRIKPTAVADNLAELIKAAGVIAGKKCAVAIFPELSMTGCTCGDLFSQRALQDAAAEGLREFMLQTGDISTIFVLGLPVRHNDRLYNAAAVVMRGELLGVVPKNIGSEPAKSASGRYFANACDMPPDTIEIAGQTAPFGTGLAFAHKRYPDLSLAVAFGSELVTGHLPARSRANVIACPADIPEEIGVAERLRRAIAQASISTNAAIVYAGAGSGESSTDRVYGGRVFIANSSEQIAEGEAFALNSLAISAEYPIARASPGNPHAAHGENTANTPGLHTSASAPPAKADPFPFVPSDKSAQRDACEHSLRIQSVGLATRLRNTGLSELVLGVSGGLDSTLAALVCAEALARLELPKSKLHCITMPGFGTSGRTFRNSEKLCETLGFGMEVVDIKKICEMQFAALGHDGQTPDITFENVQARERTQILMNRANMLGGLVIGTGGLSELALGWCTYNGDHMSMYAVNCGVPKTLARAIVRWYMERRAGARLARILRDILDTPVSPELLPAQPGEPAQETEKTIGSYELHDFFLYHFSRFGLTPARILRLAKDAFEDRFEAHEIERTLSVFLKRFLTNQFKRSCLPDGPQVTCVSLSPRGGLYMPSDASAQPWL